MMRIPPEWAIEVRSKMYANGIRSRDVAKKIGKSDQWVSNILTGLYTSDSMQSAICERVDRLIKEKAKASA